MNIQPTPAPDPRHEEIKQLAEACKLGDVPQVTELLDRHPDVLDSPDHDERFHYPGSCLWSPLYIAAMHGHEALVKMLLARGANPVPYDVAGQYHHLTYWDWLNEPRGRGYGEIVEAIEAAIVKCYGPLMDDDMRKAVGDGDVERMRALVADKPERVRQVDAVGNTPLHLAVAANNIEQVRLLIESGAAIDARNGDGRTPAVVAMYGLHRYWRHEPKPEILELLLSNGAAYTILIAAHRGDEARVRELLQSDPSLANAADACHRRPLSAATANGHTAIVRLLLEHGADPNGKEAVCQGGYSLHNAVWNGHTEIVHMLLEHGARPEYYVDSSGDCVFAAHHQKHTEILHLLYSYGATMELQVYSNMHRIDVIAEILKREPSLANEVLPYGWDDSGSEELAHHIMMLAIRYGARFEKASGWNLRWTLMKYPRLFQLLQKHGASADVVLLGITGDMSRRYGTPERQLGMVAFLVEQCGANVNCRDEEGFTPLAKAAGEGHRLLVEYLLARGAKLQTDAPDWAQPIPMATRREHKEILELLQQHAA